MSHEEICVSIRSNYINTQLIIKATALSHRQKSDHGRIFTSA